MATLTDTPEDKRRQAGVNRLIAPPPEPGMVDELGRQAGLTARAGLKGVGNLVGLLSDPIGGVINAATGAKLQTAGSLADRVSDAIGLPQPKDGIERGVQEAASAMASGGPLIGAGSRLAQSAAPVVRGLGEFFGSAPIAQTASNAASAAAASAANENGAGPIGQVAAGVAGAMFPFAAQASGKAAGKIAQVAYDNAGAVPAVRGPLAQQDGIFAGHLSKDAPTWKLEQAKTLQSKGVPDEQIYKETGWFAGMPDKQWRYEIPDNKATFNLKDAPVDAYGAQELPIYDALNHPQLKSAYPKLGEVQVQHWPDEDYKGASFNHGDKTITLGHEAMRLGSSVPLHEMQHAVQQYEGFALGGSSNVNAWANSEYRPLLLKQAQNTIETWKPAPYEQFWGGEVTPEGKAAYDAYVKDWNSPEQTAQRWKAAQEGAPGALYQNLAGEVEARLVQKRMNYTPEQRAAIYPPSEVDVPLNQQIVRLDGNGPQEAIGGNGPIAAALKDKYPALDGYIMEPAGKPATLNKIVVPKEMRGQGIGTQFMQDLAAAADQNGTRVALTPSSDFGGNKARLEQFYKQFGFVPNKGRTKDFEISEGMYRDPRAD
jgi:GNAT superfamily N-acetyltransferase